MTPKKLSDSLRLIASAIDNSKNPDREAVLQDLRRLSSSLRVAEETEEVAFKLYEYTGEFDGNEIPFYVYFPAGRSKATVKDPYSGKTAARVGSSAVTPASITAEMKKAVKKQRPGTEEETEQETEQEP